MAGFRVALDACVLVPVSLADTLLRIAERGQFHPVWSATILDEVRRALVRVHPDTPVERFDRRLAMMNAAFEDACVTGWEQLVDGVELPDPDDRHVVAAGLRGRAELIVTANVSDFPDWGLHRLGMHATTPDEFLLDQLDLAPELVVAVLYEQAEATRNPALTIDDVLDSLAAAGAPRFAARVSAGIAS